MYTMKYADRKQRAAEMWRLGCELYDLLSIGITNLPKGKISHKNITRKIKLRDGTEKQIEYHYETILIMGKEKFSLPSKESKEKNCKITLDDKRWEIREQIQYRKQIEANIQETKRKLADAISNYNIYKKSTEKRETYDTVMERVKISFQTRQHYEEIYKYAISDSSKSKYEKTGLLVTELNEAVRSKNENIFANKLFAMKVPYIYELDLKNGVVPDFTLFVNGKVYFVEILGMVDQDNYKEYLTEKTEKYKAKKIIMGKNLIFIDLTQGINMTILREIIENIIEDNIPNETVFGYDRELYEKNLCQLKVKMS